MYDWFMNPLIRKIVLATLLVISAPLSAFAGGLPTITAASTDFVAMTSKLSFDKTIALYGENLDYILFNDVQVRLGPEVATTVSGNATGVNVTFSLTPAEFTHDTDYYIELWEGDARITRFEQPVRVSNPLFYSPAPRKTRKFINNTKNKKVTKRTVGLNVHWALGAAEDEDELFEQKIDNSKTKWVREHISYADVMGENGRGWLERYDEVMLRYKEKNIRVVAMLAYGSGDDVFVPPSKKEWARFVRKVSKRYAPYVDAWEVWNEPDSPSFMKPNTVAAVKQLMKSAYGLLKYYDPTSVVLNGPIGDISNTKFVRNMYKKAGQYFDELSIHLYYCDEYVHNGNNGKLFQDLDALYKAIPRARRDQKIWITELGCSNGTAGVDDALQKRYLKKTVRRLVKTGRFRTILLYTIRNRPYLGAYEANFGLMNDEGVNKPAWGWYRRIPRKQ